MFNRIAAALALAAALFGCHADSPPADEIVSEGEIPAEANNPLAALPLVELASGRPGGLMAVIYSGDGGWRGLDKQIGELLAQRGVPVVGVDSLRYFRQPKTPDQVASDLALILQTYGERWRSPRVILIGYSFGAGILPFAYNRLAPERRAQVVQLSLLGLEPRAAFEIKATGGLGVVPAEGSHEVLPELRQIGSAGIQCFYGEDEGEEDTPCRSPELRLAEIVRTEGGHRFDGDSLGVARRILAGAKRRSSGRNASRPR